MADAPEYRRAVLRTLFPEYKHPLLHTDPPNYRGDLLDETRRAITNAAILDLEMQKPIDPDHRERIADAYAGERRIVTTCEYLIDLRGEAAVN